MTDNALYSKPTDDTPEASAPIASGPREILVSNTFAFEKEISRLNKKAAKIGVNPIIFRNIGQRTVARTIVTSLEGETSERRVPVTVTVYELTTPSVEERTWKLIGRINPIEGEKKNFVELFAKDFDRAPYEVCDPCKCDHCQSNRTRKFTYIVRNADTKEIRQLGRNCFADYIGEKHLAALEFRAFLAVTLGENDDDFIFPGAPRGIECVAVRDCVAMAELVAEEMGGWRNNTIGDFGEISSPGTHRIAANYLRGKEQRKDDKHAVCNLAPKAIDRRRNELDPVWAKVDAIISRTQSAEIAKDDEFGQALAQCAEYSVIPAVKAGLIAYLGEYWRNRERRAELEAKKATLAYVGTVGKREIFTLTCRKISSFENDFGTVTIYAFNDVNGNELVWKASGTPGLCSEGQTVTVKATVKEHSEYRGAKQTKLSRVVNV